MYKATITNQAGTVLFTAEGDVTMRDEIVWLFNDAISWRAGEVSQPNTGVVSAHIEWTRNGETETLVATIPGQLGQTLIIEPAL